MSETIEPSGRMMGREGDDSRQAARRELSKAAHALGETVLADARSRRSEWAKGAHALGETVRASDMASETTTPTGRSWREHAANPHPEQYVADSALQRRVEELATTGGLLTAACEVNKSTAGDGADRQYNCAECARSVAETLNGRPTAADGLRKPGQGERLDASETWAERLAGPAFEASDGFKRLRSEMIDHPDQQAIVCIERKSNRELLSERELESAERWLATLDRDAQRLVQEHLDQRQPGHMFNVATIDGNLTVIDGQSGLAQPFDDSPFIAEMQQQAARMRWLTLDRKETRRVST